MGRPLDRARVRAIAEPWRDWAVLALETHGVLLAVALTRPSWPWLLVAALVLGQAWATATLTVLHDAGHRRFGPRPWVNAIAVHTAVPAGFWVEQWSAKHRVHHRQTQVYPFDEATKASGMVRLHPEAPLRPVHRYQHLYTWALYGLAWAGELRNQLSHLRAGLAGVDVPLPRRVLSWSLEKALCVALVAPYVVLMGWWRAAVLLLVGVTVASFAIGVVTVVGHVNIGIDPPPGEVTGSTWTGHVVRTTASFSTHNPVTRWLTGAMTHHVAHHLRPVAPRAVLPELHVTTVPVVASRAGAVPIEFTSLLAAVRGHHRRLRELGRPAVPVAVEAPDPSVREVVSVG